MGNTHLATLLIKWMDVLNLKNLYLLLFWPLVSVETDCDIQTGDKLKKNLIRWLCYAVRGIGLSCFEFTCPLGERNHCKSILRCSELSPLAYDETFLMGVVSLREKIIPPSTGPKGSLMCLMCVKIMWVISYDLCSHQTTTQFDIYGRLWTNILRVLFTIITQMPNQGI